MKKKDFILSCFCLLQVLLQAQTGISFEKTYGLPGYNYGIKAFQTADSGYIILGNRSNYSGNNDIYLIRTDKNGNLIWDKDFGSYPVEWATDFVISKDHHLMVTGYTNQNISNGYDALLLKIDTVGNLKWMKTYGGQDWDFGFSITEHENGGFYIAGETYSFGTGGDVFLIRTDNNGDTVWTRNYGGVNEDAGLSIIPLPYENYLISGYTYSFGSGMSDCYIVKIKADGDTIFTKHYGSTGDDRINSATQNSNGDYIFAGFTENNTMLKDGLVFRTDTNGNKLEEMLWGQSGNEEFIDVLMGKDGALIFTGYTSSYGNGNKDVYAISFKGSGNWIGNTFGSSYNDIGSSICQTMDNGYLIAGSTEGKGPDISDIYLIKTDSLMHTDTNSIHITRISNKFEAVSDPVLIFPNPVSDEIWIKTTTSFSGNLKIQLYNILGQLEYETYGKIGPDESTLYLKIPFLGNGYYIISIEHPEMKMMKKIMVLNKN